MVVLPTTPLGKYSSNAIKPHSVCEFDVVIVEFITECKQKAINAPAIPLRLQLYAGTGMSPA